MTESMRRYILFDSGAVGQVFNDVEHHYTGKGRPSFVEEQNVFVSFFDIQIIAVHFKVLFDFLNRRSFENWSSKTERDLRGQIVQYLDSVQGADRLIEKFKIIRFEQDQKQKDRIYLEIHMTPFFPAKSFVIKLDGTKGDDGTNWNTNYEQA